MSATMDALSRHLRIGTNFTEFAAHIHIVDLYNVPLLEGDCRIKWKFKNAMALGHTMSQQVMSKVASGAEGYQWERGAMRSSTSDSRNHHPDDYDLHHYHGIGSPITEHSGGQHGSLSGMLSAGGVAKRMYRDTRHAFQDMKQDVKDMGKRIRSSTSSTPSNSLQNSTNGPAPPGSNYTLPSTLPSVSSSPRGTSFSGNQLQQSGNDGHYKSGGHRDAPRPLTQISQSADPRSDGSDSQKAPTSAISRSADSDMQLPKLLERPASGGQTPQGSYGPNFGQGRPLGPPKLNSTTSHRSHKSIEVGSKSRTDTAASGNTLLGRSQTNVAESSTLPENLPAKMDAKGSTPQLPLKKFACHFDQHVLCAVAIPINKATGQLSSCPVRLTVRHKVRVTPLITGKGGLAQRIASPFASHRDLATTLKAENHSRASFASSSSSVAVNPAQERDRNIQEEHEETNLGELNLDLREFVMLGVSGRNKDRWIKRRFLLQNGRTNALLRIAVRMEWIGGEKTFRAPKLRTGVMSPTSKRSADHKAASIAHGLTSHNNASSPSVGRPYDSTRNSSASSIVDVNLDRDGRHANNAGLDDDDTSPIAIGSRLDGVAGMPPINHDDHAAAELIDAIFADRVAEIDGTLLGRLNDFAGNGKTTTAKGAAARMEKNRFHDPTHPPHAGYDHVHHQHHHRHAHDRQDSHLDGDGSVLVTIPAGQEAVTGKRHSHASKRTDQTGLSSREHKPKRYEGLDRAHAASQAQALLHPDTSKKDNAFAQRHTSFTSLMSRTGSGVFKPLFARRDSNASVASSARLSLHPTRSNEQTQVPGSISKPPSRSESPVKGVLTESPTALQLQSEDSNLGSYKHESNTSATAVAPSAGDSPNATLVGHTRQSMRDASDYDTSHADDLRERGLLPSFKVEEIRA